jgi:hypothetical protein
MPRMRFLVAAGAVGCLFVALFANRAEARLFAYTYGAGCCVDHFHYFRCPTGRIVPGGGYCEYRGYWTPRQCDGGFYSLYDCWKRPNSNVSPAYSCCYKWDGCTRQKCCCLRHKLEYGCRAITNDARYVGRHLRHKELWRQYAGSRATLSATNSHAPNTDHLYQMLYDVPSRYGRCVDRRCHGYQFLDERAEVETACE